MRPCDPRTGESFDEITPSHCPPQIWNTIVAGQTGILEVAGEMSALGQKRTFGPFIAMSALPPKADIAGRDEDVRFVPIGDIIGRRHEM